MKKILTTIYILAIVLVGGVGILFLASMMPIAGNVEVKVVKSGSMEPAIHVGSIVVIKPAALYQVGDVITFGKDTKTQIPTTHRITAMSGEGENTTFTTKGDANDSEDNAATSIQDVHGKVVFTVPFLGYVLGFARTPLGFVILVGLPALLVFVEEGFAIYKEITRGRRRSRRASAPEVIKEPAYTQPPQQDIRRRKVMGTMGVVVGLGVITLGGYLGNTVAFYANSATSHNNTMQAGIFDVPALTAFVLGAFEVSTSEAVVSEPEEPKEAAPEETPTPEETPVPEEIPAPEETPIPEVEVSEFTVVEPEPTVEETPKQEVIEESPAVEEAPSTEQVD